jgi:hypothetical protein
MKQPLNNTTENSMETAELLNGACDPMGTLYRIDLGTWVLRVYGAEPVCLMEGDTQIYSHEYADDQIDPNMTLPSMEVFKWMRDQLESMDIDSWILTGDVWEAFPNDIGITITERGDL